MNFKMGRRLKHKPNWLLRSLIAISVCIHLIVFAHVAGIYQSKAVTFIELTLKNPRDFTSRNIPAPTKIRKPQSVAHKSTNIATYHVLPVSTALPVNCAPQLQVHAPVVSATAYAPKIEITPLPDIVAWTPPIYPKKAQDSAYMDPRDYLNSIRLRIENKKRYPSEARKKQVEGKATVRFIITREGELKELKISRSARNIYLDRAAIEAVKKAAPFPSPPLTLFPAPLQIEITIVFELRPS